jgi:hypothetical protein
MTMWNGRLALPSHQQRWESNNRSCAQRRVCCARPHSLCCSFLFRSMFENHFLPFVGASCQWSAMRLQKKRIGFDLTKLLAVVGCLRRNLLAMKVSKQCLSILPSFLHARVVPNTPIVNGGEGTALTMCPVTGFRVTASGVLCDAQGG